MITQLTSGPAYTPGLPPRVGVRNTQLDLAAAGRATADVVFYTWWRRDGYADLPHLPNFSVEVADDRLIAEISRLDRAEVVARVHAGHRPYVARLGGTPVAYGWSALNCASI